MDTKNNRPPKEVSEGQNRKHTALRAVLLVLPFPLLFAALLLVCLWGFREIGERAPLLRYVLSRPAAADTVAAPGETDPPETELPVDTEKGRTGAYPGGIAFGSQWAVLNIEGWSRRDIPVYEGDNDRLLSLGAGHWAGSRFPGQNGKIVLSAHVMTDFFELETTPVGTEVTLATSYGTYIYRVAELRVFSETEPELLYPQDGTELLLLYTCYPRSVGIAHTEQRCALLCVPVHGEGGAS